MTAVLNLLNQSSGTPQETSVQTETTATETESTGEPAGPLFVVTENPLGPLGLISALITDFGLYKISNKK